jgi:hypothetical protein
MSSEERVELPTWFEIKEIHGSQCLMLSIGKYMAGRTDQYGVDRATITLLQELIPSLQKSLDTALSRTPNPEWDGVPVISTSEEDVEHDRRLIG